MPGDSPTPARSASLPELWRQHPEILFVPLAAVLLIVNVGPWGYGPQYVINFALYFSFQRSNPIFPLTWSLSVALFGSTLWLLYRYRLLDWGRRVLVAGTLPFAAVALFEIPYDLCYRVAYPSAGITAFYVGSIATWLALGLTSVAWWKCTVRYAVALGAFVAGFGVWLAVGFPTIDRAVGASLEVAYGFNLALKVACFPVAALPLWEGLRARKRASDPSKSAAPAPSADG
jgi:hypothetical protein